MGIKDLYKIIPEEHAIIYKFEELRGIRLAVDISIFLYKTIRSCGEHGWKSSFMLLLCLLKSYNMKAVCIFDGPNQPVEKKTEQVRRRVELAKATKRLADCQHYKDLLEKRFIEEEEFVLDELTKSSIQILIRGKSRKQDFTNYHDIVDVINSLSNIIQKLLNQTLPITEKHKEDAKDIVKMMGLHCIQSTTEAEGTCVSLANAKKVDAVLTEDGDVLCYGVNLMLAFKKFKYHDKKVIGYYLPAILEELNMTQSQFTDMCILLGCDYNNRIKGYPQDGKKRKGPVSIGKKHALDFMTEYTCIEDILAFIPDPEPLNYQRCRELFIPPDISDLDAIPYNIEPDYDALEKLIEEENLSIKLDYIKACYETKPIVCCENETDSSDNISIGDSDTESEEIISNGVLFHDQCVNETISNSISPINETGVEFDEFEFDKKNVHPNIGGFPGKAEELEYYWS